MARPTKFTQERCNRFLSALAAGSFPEVAARFAGWSPASLYRYLRLTTPEAVAFQAEILRVVTELEVRLVGTVTTAAFHDPRLALSLLDRRFGERWSRRAAAQPLEDAASADPAAPTVVLDPAVVEAILPKLLEARSGVAPDPGRVARFAHERPAREGGLDE